MTTPTPAGGPHPPAPSLRSDLAVPARELADAHLAAIVHSSDDAIVSKNLQGIVQSWNAGAERMFGYAAEEMIGQPITVLFPPDRLDEEEQILARLKRGERVDHFETVRRTKDGRLISVSVSISPVRDARGEIVGASKVARDISESKRAYAERESLLAAERAARSEAERQGRLKDEFLATLSHELRTPLSAVLGWATILRRNPQNQAALENGLEVIERNARLQSRLIEDLLDMSRVMAGKLQLHPQPVELGSVIHAAVESVRAAADAKGVTLTHELDHAAGLVWGDSARLQQVIWNLLSNAVKFTPKGGRVHATLQRKGSHITVSVSDTGEGIAPAFLPHVFERFRQADSSAARRHGGLGLGLAIAKQLVEMHGGSIAASSAGPGQGSAFTVLLPARVPQGVLEQAQQEDSAAAAPGPSLAGLRVLAVDDEADARDLLCRILTDAGAEVRVECDAKGALRELQTDPPDVFITDIGMPGTDGYALMRQVRALPGERGGKVPAVALTAFVRAEDRRRALLSGFQMHVPKPVEAAELLTVLASLTGRLPPGG